MVARSLRGMLVLAGMASAANWYVSTTGKDSNDGKTLATPFLTVAKATGAVAAGDSIYIRSGTYASTTPITITTSGTAAKSIWMGIYPADLKTTDSRPILDFSGMALASANQGIVHKAGYWHMFGFRIKGAGDNGMLVRSSAAVHNTFEFLDFYENRDAGMQIRESAANNLILNCDSYHNADYVAGSSTSDGGNADGFAPKLDVGTGNIFRGCRAWQNTDDGWDGYLKATEVGLPDGMLTTLENCWAWGNGYYWKDGSTTSGMNGNGIKMGGSANKNQAHNFLVKNCLAWNNKSKGFDQNNSAGSLTLYNCTSISNKAMDFALNSSGVTYASGAKTTVVNSVAYGTKGTDFRSGATLTTNNFAAAASDFVTVTDTTGLAGLRKVDGSLPDISFGHLKTGSKLIDAGTVISGMSYNGSKPDLGAFETGTVVGIRSVSGNGATRLFTALDGRAHLFVDQDAQVSIAVLDAAGRMAQRQDLGPVMAGRMVDLDFSGLKAGIYLVNATGSNGFSATSRLVVR